MTPPKNERSKNGASVAGKPTTIAIRATADGTRAAKGLKHIQSAFNKTAASFLNSEKKIQTANAKSAVSSRNKISVSKKLRFAMAKEAAGTDKTKRSILALNIKYERSAAKMRKLAKAGKPIPMTLARQAASSKKAAAALARHAKKSENLRKAFKKLGKAAMIAAPIAAGAIAVMALVKGFRMLARQIRESVQKSLEFEKATTEVMTIATDASFTIAGVRKQTLALAQAYGSKPVEQAKALYTAISGGANTAAKATAIMTHANRLAISGVTDVETAVNGLVNITNVYGNSNEQVAATANMLQAGIKAGKTTAAELSAELGQVSSMAKESGVSLQEVVAAVATITTKGVTTSMAVTQLRSAIEGLGSTKKKTTAEAERLGIAFSKSSMAAKGLVPFLKEITTNAKYNENTLKALFGRTEAVNAVLNLVATDGGAKYIETLDSVVNSETEVEDAMQAMMSTMGFQINKTDALREATQIAFGEAVTGSEAAQKSVKHFNEFLSTMLDLFNSPEGRAAVNDFFVMIAEGVSVAITSLQYLAEHVDRIGGNFKRLFGQGEDFTAMTLEQAEAADVAAGGYKRFTEALDKFKYQLTTVGDEAHKTGDKERKAAIEAEKVYQKAYAAAAEARQKSAEKKARALRKEIQDERNASQEKTRIDREEKTERKKIARDWRDHVKATLDQMFEDEKAQATRRLNIALAGAQREADQYQAGLERQNDDLAAMDQKITERSQSIQSAFQSAASAMQAAWSSAFEGVGRLVTETETEIVRNEEGLLEEREKVVGQHIKTSSDAFSEFTQNVGKMILAEIGKYIVALGVKMLADKVAALWSVGASATEAAGKQMSAHAWIPFVGVAAGLAAAGAIVAATRGFGDDMGSVPSLPQAPKFNQGGFVSGPAGRDRVPAWLSAGEFVIPRQTVDQIRRGRTPATAGHYADGGTVQGNGGGGNINVTLASSIPPDRIAVRRMVRDVIMPELRSLHAAGV